MKDKTKQARELRKKIDRSLDDWKNSKDDLDRLVWFIAIQSPHNLWRAREALGQVLTAKEKEVIERIDKAISQSRKEVLEKVEDRMAVDRIFDELNCMPPIPPWFGTKHGTQERGEMVATRRLFEQLKSVLQSLKQK